MTMIPPHSLHTTMFSDNAGSTVAKSEAESKAVEVMVVDSCVVHMTLL